MRNQGASVTVQQHIDNTRKLDSGQGVGPEAYVITRRKEDGSFHRIGSDGETSELPDSAISLIRAILSDKQIDGKTGALSGAVLVLTVDAMRDNDHLEGVLIKLIDSVSTVEQIDGTLSMIIFADDKPITKIGGDFVGFFAKVIRRNVLGDVFLDVNVRDRSGMSAIDYAIAAEQSIEATTTIIFLIGSPYFWSICDNYRPFE